jgi:hypothetical protein
LKIIHKNCNKELCKDKSLPLNSYLITYILDEDTVYDIVQSNSKVEIFDYYYDNYGNVLTDICWTSGTVNPKLWGEDKPKKKIK